MSVSRRKKLPVELTFASDREQNQTTLFTDISRDQILNEIDVGGVSTLANARNQAYSNTFSPTVKRGEGGKREGVPGRSQNDKSVSSGPLISRDTQFLENVSSRELESSSGPVKNVSGSMLGQRMAR